MNRYLAEHRFHLARLRAKKEQLTIALSRVMMTLCVARSKLSESPALGRLLLGWLRSRFQAAAD